METIQPITNPPLEISVTAPVSAALERVKQVLFRPFDPGKWFTIGFCAWLALLGEQGGGGIGNYNFGPHNGGQGAEGFRHGLEQAKAFVMSNLFWIVPVVAGVVILCLGVWVLFTWLNSRGKFMFLHCVALDKAEVALPWHKFAREANSLFRFRIALGLIGTVLMLPLVAWIAILVIGMVKAGTPNAVGVILAAGASLVLIAVGLVFGGIKKLTKDFVVPIMFLRGTTCRAGWRELRGLLPGNIGNLILYFLFQIVLGIVIGLMVLIVVLMTCCLAGCVLLLPYLGTVLLLPVLVFHRAYSAYYLAQLGPEFDVFRPALT
jgi:hypothetical protein